jgi:aminoglycoside 2'-N-acetyltransferase I
MDALPGLRIHRRSTDELSVAEARAIRDLLWRAFGTGEEAFTEDDWAHALGGLHLVAEADRRIVGHAAVVERWLEVGGRPLRTGYVEAVAVEPPLQGRGVGRSLMDVAGAHILKHFELGALGTGEHGFYERLGWRTWQGPSGVRLPSGELRPTPDEDGYILVLPTPSSPPLDWTAPISCDWREGDVW